MGLVMRQPFRSKQEVIINAPFTAVWSVSMDLTKIPEFPPRVAKVDLLAGKAFREAGVSYQCYLSGGKHTCIEKDVEIVPLEKIVTVLPHDTFGVSKILDDYTVETTFQKLGDSSTKVEISHYYSTTTLKAKLLSQARLCPPRWMNRASRRHQQKHRSVLDPGLCVRPTHNRKTLG